MTPRHRELGAAAARPPRRLEATPTRPGRSSTGCCADNYVHARRCCATVPGPTASRTPDRRAALGVFKDPDAAAGRVPRPDGGAARAAAARPPTTTASSTSTTAPTRRPSTTSSRSTTSSIREWRPTAACRRDAAARPPRQERLRRQGRRTSRCCARSWRWLLEPAAATRRTRTPIARRARSSITSRSASCSTRDVAALKNIIDRMVYMSGDDEIAVTRAPGHAATRPSASRSPTCTTRTRPRRSSRRRSARRSARSRSTRGPTAAPWRCCVYYFDDGDARAPDRRRAACARSRAT